MKFELPRPIPRGIPSLLQASKPPKASAGDAKRKQSARELRLARACLNLVKLLPSTLSETPSGETFKSQRPTRSSPYLCTLALFSLSFCFLFAFFIFVPFFLPFYLPKVAPDLQNPPQKPPKTVPETLQKSIQKIASFLIRFLTFFSSFLVPKIKSKTIENLMRKGLLKKWPTSISYGKTHYEINFLIKRVGQEKLARHRKKRQKNTSKLASFSDRFFFDFWYQNPSPKRVKIDKKSIQKRCATRSFKKASPRQPKASPKAAPGTQNPLQKKFPASLFGSKMAPRCLLDALGHCFPSRTNFWTILAASGAPPD